MSCLVDHRGNISEYQCNQYITKMTSIIFSDYRLICGFMDKCKEDVNNWHCGSINVGHKVGSARDKFLSLSLDVYGQKTFRHSSGEAQGSSPCLNQTKTLKDIVKM